MRNWPIGFPSSLWESNARRGPLSAQERSTRLDHGADQASLVPFPDGTTGRFPHIIERGKPGIIGVLADGRRFCNEGNGYYDYVDAMLRTVPAGQEVASWLICTRAFQRRYGLGITRPAPLPVEPYIKSGYVKAGRTIAELARNAGIDPEGLERTVAEYNLHALKGEDPAFSRGSTLYNRYQGDASNKPNPCVAPIEHGPFYAVKVMPGSFGTFAGLKTDGSARVLGAARRPDPRALCGRHGYGERHGRPLPRRRDQPRPGDDVRLHRRSARGRSDRIREQEKRGRSCKRRAKAVSTVFSLAHLTVLDLPPTEAVRVAARTGYQYVGLRLIAVTDTTPGYPLMDDPAMMRDTKAALVDTGVRVLDIEFVKITPEIDVANLERFVAAGADLGAKYVITAPYDPDLTRLADRLGAISDLSARYGLRAVLEFFPWTVVPDLSTAVQIVEAAGRTQTGILVDTLHFNRSGSRFRTTRQHTSLAPTLRPRLRRAGEGRLHNRRIASRGPGRAAATRRGRDRYTEHPAAHATGHTGGARGADDGDARCRGRRSGRAPGATGGGALTVGLSSQRRRTI